MRSIARASDNIFVQSGDLVRFPGYSGPVQPFQDPDLYTDPHTLGRELLKSRGWQEKSYPNYGTTHYTKDNALIITGPFPDHVSYHSNYGSEDNVVSSHPSILEAYRHHQKLNKRFTPRR